MSRRYRKGQKKRQQQKVNPVYAGMTIIDGMTQPRSMPRNYKAYSEEGYAGNDTLFKVVNYALINGATIPPVLYADKEQINKPNAQIIESHAILDLLNKPNPEQSGVFFRKAVLGYFLIAGNSFIYANCAGDPRAMPKMPPGELWTLPPDRVKPIPDENRGIIGYQYDDWPAEKNPIHSRLIGHVRTWNPKDPFFGMSAIEPGAIMIDSQTSARKWNYSLLENKLVLPGAWTTDALLDKNTRSKLEERVNQKFAGYRNSGKAPVLDGALKWQPYAVNPSDFDWKELLTTNKGDIANLYNMPPELIGDTSASTFNNKEMAAVASYTEYIFPTLDDVYDLLNVWLVPFYSDLCDRQGNPTAYLYYDKNTIEVIRKIIQDGLTAAAQRGNTSYMQGVAMLDEAREMQGLPPLPNGTGKVFRLGAVLVPADKIMDYAEQSLTTPAAPPSPMPEPIQLPPGQDDQEKPPVDGEKPDDGKEPPSKQPANEPPQKRIVRLHATKALDLSTAEEKAAYAASMEKTRAGWEKKYQQELANYFDQEHKAVMGTINSSSSTGALAGQIEGTINEEASSHLKAILLNLYHDVAVDVGGQVAASLKGQKGIINDFIKLFGESQLKYLLLLAGNKIQQISSTIQAKIRLELTEGAANGESIPQLAKRIDALYLDQIIPNRSTVIARTEVVSSSNWASIQSAQNSGLTLNKVWLATEDSRTRPAHADADGQKVGMDEKFDVGGEQLDYPGDSAGSPGNVIECRCTVYYERVQVQSDNEDDTEDEKRLKRDMYRKFMHEVLV